MVFVPTTSRLHTKTLVELSWPWLIWIIVAIFSLVGVFLVCLVVHHIVDKVQAAVAARAVPQEETKPILPTHDYSYAQIPAVVSLHSLQSPEIPAWSLQGSYESSADPIFGPSGAKDVTIRLEDTVEEDTDFQHFRLLQSPRISLASRSPNTLSQILDVCTTSDDGNTDATHTPSFKLFSQFSSIEEISVSSTQSAGASPPSPFQEEANPDVLIFGALSTIDAAAADAATTPSRSSILGHTLVPTSDLPASEEKDVFYNPKPSTEAVRAYTARARGPDVTRSPAQITLMNELGLDYIDARIATVTGHYPSAASSQSTYSTMQLLSPRFAQQSSYRRPLSVPLIGFLSTSTRTSRQIELEHSSRRGRPKIVPMPPRRFSQTTTSLLRQRSLSLCRPQTTDTLSTERRSPALMKEHVDNTSEVVWDNGSPLRIPLGPTTWQLP